MFFLTSCTGCISEFAHKILEKEEVDPQGIFWFPDVIEPWIALHRLCRDARLLSL